MGRGEEEDRRLSVQRRRNPSEPLAGVSSLLRLEFSRPVVSLPLPIPPLSNRQPAPAQHSLWYTLTSSRPSPRQPSTTSTSLRLSQPRKNHPSLRDDTIREGVVACTTCVTDRVQKDDQMCVENRTTNSLEYSLPFTLCSDIHLDGSYDPYDLRQVWGHDEQTILIYISRAIPLRFARLRNYNYVLIPFDT